MRAAATPQKTPQKGAAEVTGLSARILQHLHNEPTLTRVQLAAKLNVGPDTVKEYLTKLKRRGLLIREGGRKTGHWVVRD
jgi:ATP-dependent DNA helicase RecG